MTFIGKVLVIVIMAFVVAVSWVFDGGLSTAKELGRAPSRRADEAVTN